MRYITDQEYLMLGGKYELVAFERNIDRACSVINTHTYGRINELYNVPQEVKALCREMVDYFEENSFGRATSVSHSVGAVSESKSYTSKDANAQHEDIMRLMYDYLGSLTVDGIPVMYKGARQ